MKNNELKQLDAIAQAIFDKKGMNIIVLDVQGISTMTDYFVIAEGSVDRHVKALSYSIEQSMDVYGEKPLRIEGISTEWVVMDYGHVVIHLFTPDIREKYAIERLWQEGKIVDVEIATERL